MITTLALMLAAVVAVANGESKLRSNTAAQVKADTCKNTDLSADTNVLNRWCQTHNTLRRNQYCMYQCEGKDPVKVTCKGSDGWEKTSKTDICGPTEIGAEEYPAAVGGCSDVAGGSGWLTDAKPYTPQQCNDACKHKYPYFTIASGDQNCKCHPSCSSAHHGHTAYKSSMEEPPSKWMSARTGRSHNKDGTPFQQKGARAHNAFNLVANLQCCSNDGSKADRKPFSGCNKDKSGRVWDGGMTWITANSICKDAGQRLCTDAEVLSEIGGYTGCNFDNKNVWTSTKWDEVPEADRASS